MQFNSIGSEEVTDRLQTILNAYSSVSLGPGLFVVHTLELRDNQFLTLDPRTVIKRVPGAFNAQMLHMYGVSNVSIEGNNGLIDGNKTDDPGTASHCVGIQGGENITIRNLRIRNAPSNSTFESYGDGVYVGSGVPRVSRLHLMNIQSTGHDRHGLFIVDCDGVTVERCDLQSDRYTSMNCEPNGQVEVIRNLRVTDTIMRNASGAGLSANNHYQGDWYNILFDRCRFEGNSGQGMYCGIGNTTRNFGFRDCLWKGNGAENIFMGGSDWWISGGETRESASHGAYLYQPKGFSVRGLATNSNTNSGMLVYFPSSDDVANGLISDVRAFGNGTSGDQSAYGASGIVIDRGSNNVGADLNLRVTGCLFGDQPHGLSPLHEMQGLVIV